MMARRSTWLVPLLAFSAWVGAKDAVPTFRAQDFVDSVGVNTHIRHKGSYYDTQFDAMKQRLLSAHITHIRDGAIDLDGVFYPRDGAERFSELGKAGIRITYVFHAFVTKEFVQGWPARVSPSFEAYEAPNEFNQKKDMPWAEAMRIWLPMFRDYVRSNPATANYPILAPSIADVGGNPHGMLGDQQANLDYGNIHKYYRAYNPATTGYGKQGVAPCQAFKYGELAYEMCQQTRVSGNKPIVATEAGYGSDPAAQNQVSREVQARYISRMLMLHLKAGIKRTFVYQLADWGRDTGGNMGLLDGNGGEKPAWRQLFALMNELADDKASKQDAAKPLPVTLGGETTDVEALAFEKADGSYRLVVWLEKPSFDPATAKPVSVAPQNVSVEIPRNFTARRAMTFGDSGAPAVKTLGASGSVKVSVTDNLTVLDISRAGS
jgi:hypothetical protein